MKSIATKFYLLIGGFLALFLVFFTYRTYTISKNYVNELVGHEAELALQFDLSIRKYVSQNVRPLMYKLVGNDEFIPETMSTSFVARSVFEDVRKQFPEFILKFSSDNPRNPLNLAGPQEMEIIDFFNANPEINEWKGSITIEDKKYVARFQARRMKEKCLRCHGDPADAPNSLLKRYGDKAGFHRPLNEVIALDTVAIPIDAINEKIWNDLNKNIFLIIACVLYLFISTYLVFRFTVSKRLSKIATHFNNTVSSENFEEIEEIAAEGNDEIASLATNFNTLAEKIASYNKSLVNEINERKHAENELKKLKDDLELLVKERTYDLHETNKKLESEIKDKIAAQESIKQSHAEISQIFNTAADGMRIVGENFTMLRANDTFLKLANLQSHDEWQGKKCYEVFWGEACHTPNCPLKKIKAEKKQLEMEVVKEKFNKGGYVHCLTKATPFYDHNNKFIGIVEDFRDITERMKSEIELSKSLKEAHELAEALKEKNAELKAAQSQMLQREKMASIGQLAAGVAHEINNPVGFITSNLGTLSKYIDRFTEYIDALKKAIKDEYEEELKELNKKLKIDFVADDAKDLIIESLDGTDRVGKIVTGLKSFSRIDEAEHKQADINECLESTINIIWNELKYKAKINKEYGELPLTKCYPQQLNQVFMNLLINASHAIEKQGEIGIKTWHQDNSIHVSISDTGSGISPENLPKLFEPFFTTKKVGKGTGLGLSISYDIVKKHEGDITVDSEIGRGTTFTIQLPVVEI